MRLNHLRLRGITEAFPNEVSVDFDTLDEGLIAIVGENGAGKSTLIGSVFAALFRQLPGQKRSLYDFATHPQPEIDLTFSVNSARYRSLLKIDPKSRQMESYLFNGEGKPLTNGKKEPFEELVRKCVGTPDFFLSSVFSSQKRTGNFLSLDRSERKELFIRELLGLDRLRLIAAAAKEKGDEVARTTLGLDGQARSLKELVEAGVEEPAEVEARLLEVSSRLESLEAEKRVAQQRLLELQAADAGRKPLLAEVETLKQRLRKTDAEITETKRQVGRDEGLLTGKKDLADLTERGATLATRIQEIHRQIREIQGLETSNREAERIVQALDGELRNNIAELERLRVEREELAVVPCRGEGSYASCPKIRRAVEAGQKIPGLEGEVSTLSLEVEVQRSSLLQIVTPSFDLTRTLESCERDRRKVDQERQGYEELRAVEARRDAFDVVVGSLPGFGFSSRPSDRGMNTARMSDLFADLMRELGYERFACHGGDFGAGVSSWLARRHPGRIIGIHLNYIPGSYRPGLTSGAIIRQEEERFLHDADQWEQDFGAYGHIQYRTPQTAAYGLNDSPAGLAAWILEKFRDWADCEGNLEKRFTWDDLLANVTLYWMTETIHSSCRLYFEQRNAPLHLEAGERIVVPCGIAHFPKEAPFPPRTWIERGYNIEHWTEMATGGHFAAMEEPEALATDIRTFFRRFR